MRMRQGRWLRAIAVAVLAAVLGCTGGGTPGAEDPTAGTTAGAVSDVGGGAEVDADSRIRVERELGHHTMLVIDALRMTADDSPRRADAQRALERRSDQVYGAVVDALPSAPGAFDAVWVPRIEALLALADGREAAAELASAQEEYGGYVAEATEGGMSAADATGQLAAHDEQLIEQLDAWRDGDKSGAFRLQRESFSNAFRMGQQVVVAAGASAEATSGATELRSAVNQLLAEHTWFATLTVRRSAMGARDARHPAAALAGNTEDLAAALLSIYGEQTAVAFDQRWRGAVAALLRFTAATVELDDEARQRAARRLRSRTRELADDLNAMTDGAIDEQAAREALSAHFRLLRRHSNAVANKRFRRASDAADEAYAGSAAVADLVAAGIAEHRADDFPK